MSQEISPSELAVPARRRIVPLSERRVALPIAIIAHEGEERDQLETQISRVRPAVCFPSLAHFGADAAQRERWAGIVVARTHAWDARLDSVVPRRAFIALYHLSDEGYGWPDSVRRVSTQEELDTWLTDLASPVLPADDRQRVVKPRAKRSVFTMSLAGDPVPVRTQLTLPSLVTQSTRKDVAAAEADHETPAAATAPQAATNGHSATGNQPHKVDSAPTAPRPRGRPKGSASAAQSAAAQSGDTASAKASSPKTRASTKASEASFAAGLRLASDDPEEQALIDAVRALGIAEARAIIDAVERFEQD